MNSYLFCLNWIKSKFKRSFAFFETETRTIYTIPFSSFFLRAIWEKMSEMTIAFATTYLCHELRISNLSYISIAYLFEKGRPSTSAIKLSSRREEFAVADHACVLSFLGAIVIFILIFKWLLSKASSVPSYWVTLYCSGVNFSLRYYLGYLDISYYNKFQKFSFLRNL